MPLNLNRPDAQGVVWGHLGMKIFVRNTVARQAATPITSGIEMSPLSGKVCRGCMLFPWENADHPISWRMDGRLYCFFLGNSPLLLKKNVLILRVYD